MKRLISALALPLMLVLVGCDGESPTAPNETLAAAELANGVAVGTASISNVGADPMVPISGRASFEPDLTLPPVACVAPFPLFARQLNAEGRFTHLGKTTSVIITDQCWFNPDQGSVDGLGHAIHTAANGDELHAQFGGSTFQDGTLVFNFITFVGGTGRFHDASGQALGGGTTSPDEIGEFWFDGMITRVGSK